MTMKNFDFPIFKTKVPGITTSFNLTDPVDRRKYFHAKAGIEIEKLQEYFTGNTFVGILLGKKNSGKGTYSKLFAEAIGENFISHISIGDIVRDIHTTFLDSGKKENLLKYLQKNYRGFIPVEKAVDALLGRDTTTLLPTEIILALTKREIDSRPRKAIFIDGFPRNLDQVSYSLFFRDLIGYRDDPDFFVFIDVPMAVIDERIKTRVICPKCHTPRSPKLLTTKHVGYDKDKKEFYLLCDNPACVPIRMVAKEGDSLGIEPIRDRLEADETVMEQLLKLQGVPKVFLRNSVPAKNALEYVDQYEITPAYHYEYDEKTDSVKTIEEPWTVKDEKGEDAYSLLPAAVTVSMVKQIAKVLDL